MSERLSPKTWLYLSFFVLVAGALLIPGWFYYRSLCDRISSDAEKIGLQRLHLIQRLIAGQVFDGDDGLQTWITELGAGLEGVRITYLRKDTGQILADSSVTKEKLKDLENLGSRSEVIQATSRGSGLSIRPGVVSGEEQLFVAEAVPARDGLPEGVIRIASPFAESRELLTRLRNSFAGVVAVICAIVFLLGYVLARRLHAPIGRMIGAVDDLASGNYHRRIHLNPDDELYPLAHAVNRMAENIDNHIRNVSEEKRQIEAVLNGMKEGVMVLDDKGRIQSINRALSEISPKVPHSTGRRPLEVLMSIELQGACDRILATEEHLGEHPYGLQIALGDERTYDVNIVRLGGEDRIEGAIVVFHDITELKRLEKVRRDFVANVSHELRTPLTSIKGYTETLMAENPPAPETLSAFLPVILKNTNHMVKMVDDLLQLARIEGRPHVSRPAPIKASDALETAWNACAPLAKSKNVRMESLLPGEGPQVFADYDQLVQVFWNLIENAVKHGPAGMPLTVDCHVGGDWAVFSLRDEGPGIPRQDQQRIFERFYRLEKHRGGGNRMGSTGLGLAICRHIIQNHGGKIWVQSPNPDDTRGSTFFFSLPVAGNESSQHGKSSEQQPESEDRSPSLDA